MSLLEQVNLKAENELRGPILINPGPADGSIAAARRVGESMIQATEFLVQRQAELWKAAVEAAGQQWAEMSASASEQVNASMSAATSELAGRAKCCKRRRGRGRSRQVGRRAQSQPDRLVRSETLRANRVEPGGRGQYARGADE